MTVTDMPAPHATVTQRLVGLSSDRGEHPALVGGTAAWPGGTLSHADLAVVLQSAAAGLAWRGLRSQDVVGVYVPDAVSYVLAVHAIRAAGGVPSPIGTASTIAMMARQLSDCGARLLVTADPLAARRAERGGRLVGPAGHLVRRGAGHRAVLVAAVPGTAAAGRRRPGGPGPGALRSPAGRRAGSDCR